MCEGRGVSGHYPRCYVSRNTVSRYYRYYRYKICSKALCTNLDGPNKDTLEMDPKRAWGCSGPGFTFEISQPPIRGLSKLGREMRFVAPKPLPKRPFRIGTAK